MVVPGDSSQRVESVLSGQLTSSAQKRWTKACSQPGSGESLGTGVVAGAKKLILSGVTTDSGAAWGEVPSEASPS